MRELTPFGSLLFQLDQDRDRAAAKYEEIHLKLVKFFEWNYCTRPEDLADETLNRIAQKVNAGEIVQDVIGFCWGVAERVRQEQRKKDRRTVPLPDLPEHARCLADGGAAVANVQARIEQADEWRVYSVVDACLRRTGPFSLSIIGRRKAIQKQGTCLRQSRHSAGQ